MMKMMSTRTHGIADYATAGALLLVPRLMGWRGGLGTFLTGAALGTAAYSAMTRYEYGPLKMLPMKRHLQLDLFNGLSFLAAPLMFRGHGWLASAFLAGVGLFEIAASQMTQTEPSYRERAAQMFDSIGDALASAGGAVREKIPV